MADSETDSSAQGGEEASLDLSGLGALDFTPSWVKKTPEENFEKYRSDRYSGDDGERRERPGRGGFRRGPGRDGSRDSGAPRERDTDRDAGRERRPFRRDEGRPQRDGAFREGRGFEPRFQPLEADVRVLPDQKALGQIIRKIQTSHHAYPMRELARLFAGNPQSIVVRVGRKPHRDGAEGARQEQLKFFQCKKCGMPALSAEELSAHVFSKHLSDYFTEETVDCEPPKGNFPCVAKCGLSGVLIGPPNLHDYNERVREMIRTRYPGMREDAYRARIEMVRDPEAVEEWRKTAVKKTVYRLKNAKPAQDAKPAQEGEAAQDAAPEAAPAYTRAEAERIFREQIAPGLVASPKAILAPAEAAAASPSRALASACRFALERESRNPVSIFYALRGAFHYRKLFFFRANDPRGQEFVTASAPAPLDTAHAVPELAAIVSYVAEHDGCTAKELVAALAGTDVKKQSEVLSRIGWLAERGHIVAFYDGVLAPPAEHPAYRRRKKEENAAPAEAGTGPQESAPGEAAAEAAPAETPAAAPAEAAPAESPAEPAGAESASTVSGEADAAPAAESVSPAQE